MTIDQKLQEVFRDVFGDESLVLHDHTSAADVPGWDSVAHINLMFALEQSFGIQFRGNELGESRNIGELKRYLETRSASAGRG
jgi:acyl carrier protein